MLGQISGREKSLMIQWFGDKHIRKNIKTFDGAAVGINEYYIQIEGGRIADEKTQHKIELPDIGLLHNKGEELQLFIINTAKFEDDICFKSHTKDYETLVGTVKVIYSISKNDLKLATSLLENDAPYSRDLCTESYREYSRDDLFQKISSHMQYSIDNGYTLSHTMEEICSDRETLNTEILTLLNSDNRFWKTFGIDIEFTEVRLEKTAYEERQKKLSESRIKILEAEADAALKDAEIKKRQIQNDIEAKEAEQSAQRAILLKQIADMERLTKERNEQIMRLENSALVELKEKEKEHALQLQELKNKGEIDAQALQNNQVIEAMVEEQKNLIEKIKASREIDQKNKDLKITEINEKIRSLERQAELNDYNTFLEKERKRQIYEAEKQRLISSSKMDEAEKQLRLKEIEKISKMYELDVEARKSMIEYVKNMNLAKVQIYKLEEANRITNTYQTNKKREKKDHTGEKKIECIFCHTQIWESDKICHSCGRHL